MTGDFRRLFVFAVSIWGCASYATGNPVHASSIPTHSRMFLQYTPSTEDFGNPERGFMKQSSIWVDQPLDATKIRANHPADTVVWIYFHLENYRDPRDGKGVTVSNYQGKPLEPIGSGRGLDTVNQAFTVARSKGLKLVIRFLYVGYPGIGSTQDPQQMEPDAPIELVRQHLGQLAPLINQQKDVIAAVQTGFVGYWGEWHSSKYLGSLANRKAVTDAVLAAVPKDRMVMLRYPRYKQLWYGGPLTDGVSYNQSDVARIGLHDDAFLKDDTDDGTFKSVTGGVKITSYCDGNVLGETSCWRQYVQQDTRFTPVGGEASVPNSPRSDCPNALLQMESMHWSFINNGFNKTVLDGWTRGGCMETIRRRLGYRFVVTGAAIPQSIGQGAAFTATVTIRNEGFASLYNPRPVIVVLSSGGNRFEISTTIDPRRWEPGREHTVTVQGTVPAAAPQGVYTIGLWLPDASQTVKANPAYAVRFANTGMWEASTGINILSTGVSLSGSASPPGVTQTPGAGCAGKSSGDANCDGSFDLVDYDYYRRIVLGDRSVPPSVSADFNGDGETGLMDGRIILQKMGFI